MKKKICAIIWFNNPQALKIDSENESLFKWLLKMNSHNESQWKGKVDVEEFFATSYLVTKITNNLPLSLSLSVWLTQMVTHTHSHKLIHQCSAVSKVPLTVYHGCGNSSSVMYEKKCEQKQAWESGRCTHGAPPHNTVQDSSCSHCRALAAAKAIHQKCLCCIAGLRGAAINSRQLPCSCKTGSRIPLCLLLGSVLQHIKLQRWMQCWKAEEEENIRMLGGVFTGERKVQFTGLNNMVPSSLAFHNWLVQLNVTKERTNCTFNGVRMISFWYRYCYCGHKSCLIICFYGDHHQVVKCREIHTHTVTCFSQFDFFKDGNKSPPSVKHCFRVWSICEGGLPVVWFLTHTHTHTQHRAEQWEQGGSSWRERGRESALRWGMGEPGCWGNCLSVEAGWKGKEGKEGKGIRAGAANHLHTRWGVRQARGTYGCRPLTQPGEHILPSEGNLNTAVKGSSWAKRQLMDFL